MTCPVHVFLDTAKVAYLILEMSRLTKPARSTTSKRKYHLVCKYLKNQDICLTPIFLCAELLISDEISERGNFSAIFLC